MAALRRRVVAVTGGWPSRRPVLLAAAALLCLLAWRADTQWRRIQASYFDRMLETSRAELAVLRAESAEDVRFLEGEVAVALDAVSARAGEVADARRRLVSLERKLRSAEARQAAAERRRGGEDETDRQEDYEAARREAEGLREQVAIQRQQLDDVESDVAAARAELDEKLAPIERLEQRIDELDGLRGWLRGLPVLRAWGAGVGERVIEPRLDAAAATPVRVERCVTCHLSMLPGALPSAASLAASSATSRGAAGDWPGLFAPHPGADLYLEPTSPHPAGDFGCTSCHGGNALATGFAAAGHVPRDDDTARRWRDRWRWRQLEPSEAPLAIRAGARVESACVACHDAPWLRGAPTQEAGRLLVRSMGCAACHEVGRPDLAPQAPSLVDLRTRKRPEWVAAFLADPRAWKPTFMPSFWPADVPAAERDAEVAAIVAWLWRQDEARAGEGEPTAAREVEREIERQVDPELVAAGRQTWHALACAACHLDTPAEPAAELGSQRLRGPSLARIAAEVRPGALPMLLELHQPRFDWRQGSGSENDEVAALAAYLGSLGSGAAVSAPRADPQARDEVLRRRLLEVTTYEDAAARLERAGEAERELLLGDLAVRRLRCGACHLLPAAPDEPWLASAALPAAGRSLASCGEDGGEDGGDDRGAGSRSCRDGAAIRDGTWRHGAQAADDADCLPRWRLTPAEAEALSIQLAGWYRPPVLSAGATDVERAGRDVIARSGCRACHDLDGRAPPQVFARRTAPPSLARAGDKLRSEWIFDHLGDPQSTSIRTSLPGWGGLRMPTFALSDLERSEVAEFFAARAGRPVLSPRVEPQSPEQRALGDAVYQVLLCDRCHAAGDSERGGTEDGPPPVQLAPSYADSGRRLRPDWLRGWLLDPQAWMGEVLASWTGESMPPPFPHRDGRPDASYLLATLDAPMFEVQRGRLERFVAERDDLERVFDDAESVADALAAYLLNLDEE